MVKVNRRGGREMEKEWHTERNGLVLFVQTVLYTHVILVCLKSVLLVRFNIAL